MRIAQMIFNRPKFSKRRRMEDDDGIEYRGEKVGNHMQINYMHE
jgi:hypothetical protein